MSDAAALVRTLTDRHETVACAESLTGGLVCARLTSVPGASAVVRGGVVSYATDVKADVLGVDAGLLAAGGAVQAQVALQMAVGVRSLLGATWGLATTGVAGPDPQDGYAVGTVFVAVASDDGAQHAALTLDGDREHIRASTVRAVLDLLGARLRS
ncbi:CinA family protein [Luteipulveratus sp. YIM 133132]|uniref:CinA family protein n=1 Tax=Luteipulveratus flavus TaxID=3031728 RepID=UPI0023B0F8E9|nr:CinA family protein [Luteipulveratus sp. YIM 133132]MDE9366211.1 CinA family protein [Luteipulveratus sp. YIM 133132]